MMIKLLAVVLLCLVALIPVLIISSLAFTRWKLEGKPGLWRLFVLHLRCAWLGARSFAIAVTPIFIYYLFLEPRGVHVSKAALDLTCRFLLFACFTHVGYVLSIPPAAPDTPTSARLRRHVTVLSELLVPVSARKPTPAPAASVPASTRLTALGRIYHAQPGVN